MSERLHTNPESRPETLDHPVESIQPVEHAGDRPEAEQQPSPEDIQKLRDRSQEQAVSSKEVAAGQPESSNTDTPTHSTYQELRRASYERSLKRIQSRLPAPQRAFSRLIHQPVIEAISESLAKTAARPSGILGGGAAALIGSCWLLYVSKAYGFAYNFFTLFVLVAAGFVLGVTLELIIRLIKPKK